MIESVSLDVEASPSEVEAVREAFRRYGFDPPLERDQERRAAGVLPWIVAVVLLLPIRGFFDGFGASAGEDAYVATKEWVRSVWEARSSSRADHGSLTIEDPDGTVLVLSSTIPDEALDALADVDWERALGDYLTWDDTQRVWRDSSRHRA